MFFSGVMIMVFELIGSRMLAPYFGSGMDSWTALIGTILAFLSIGYYLGGVLADRRQDEVVVGYLLLSAAVSILTINYLRDWLLVAILNFNLSLIASVVAAGVLLFAVPSILLGMVQPYIVKLSIAELAQVGKISGAISTLSTAGGIVGTFLGGFYLLPLLGTNRALYAVVFGLLLLSLGYAKLRLLKSLVLLAAVLSLLTPPVLGRGVVADIDTTYSRVLVKDVTLDNRPARVLTFDPFGYQSGIYLDNPDESANKYTAFLDYGLNFHPDPKQILVVGGGAFVYPELLARRQPDMTISVFEVDARLLDIARDYMDYDAQENVRVYTADGRYGLRELSAAPDVVFLDAFGGLLNIPFHLTTREYLQELKSLSAPDVVVVANVIGNLSADKVTFLEAYLATFEQEFAHVQLLQNTDTPVGELQNFTIIAQNSQPRVYGTQNLELAQREITVSTADTSILTDDRAPVEYCHRQFFR